LKRRELGKSGIEVPVVGGVIWQVFDVRGPEQEARHELVRAALEEGANSSIHLQCTARRKEFSARH
jgi:aryl-alcohol dehydrogenase-like predicted oxidoreductase